MTGGLAVRTSFGQEPAVPGFVPKQSDRPEPIVLAEDDPALLLIERIRDEAHRFAVTYHRKVRTRRTVTTRLFEVPGIGVTRARRLLTTFGSVRGILAADPQRLEQEVGRALADRIRRHFARTPESSEDSPEPRESTPNH
jgi:excinuclease ABC subunit C